VELSYRSRAEIERDHARDPLLGTAQFLIDVGAMSSEGVIDLYEKQRDLVMATAAEALHEPQLASRAEVVAPMHVRDADGVAVQAARAAEHGTRIRAHGGRLPEDEGPHTLAQSINRALADVLARYPEALLFGEDVARKGGVYGVTRGLVKHFGAARVFDTLLDEQTILGLGLGSAVSGLLPIPEIQYLAYLHNAEDQIRGEGASLPFFSNGAYTNPMVVRIAGYAYQKGFGGHFHNDNSIAVLRDIPGIVVATPARPGDAAPMLRTCAATAKAEGRLCVFVEPIALYHARDLHSPGDGRWLDDYAPVQEWGAAHVPVGSARTYGDGDDVTIITFGNGLFMSLRVAHRLEQKGMHCRVVDLRWLAPLPVEDILREAEATGHVLVVDETRMSGGVSESVVATLNDAGFRGRVGRVNSADSFVPLGEAANLVLVGEQDIERAVRDSLR
jgi:2-oxoisovalerate dehydrogenase E1 component